MRLNEIWNEIRYQTTGLSPTSAQPPKYRSWSNDHCNVCTTRFTAIQLGARATNDHFHLG